MLHFFFPSYFLCLAILFFSTCSCRDTSPRPALLCSAEGGAGIGAGGTLLTGVPIGAWLDADAAATFTLAPAAAQQPITGHAGVRARGTVAVVAGPVRVTQAVPTAALAVS